MKTLFHVLAVAASGLAAVATAQTTAPTTDTAAATGRERIRQVIVYGNDPCPRSSADEIVVCARRPDNERYRIPENLRDGERMRDGESWAVRAESLETIGDAGIQSCSTSGPGGFTGCWAEMMRQYRANRRNAQPRPTDD